MRASRSAVTTPLRDLDADLPQKRLRCAAGSDDRRGVPGARALEGVPDVVVTVLHDAGEIGMAGPRQRHRLFALPFGFALRGPRAHPPRPVPVVSVSDDERERCPQRPPVPEPREHLNLVGLDLLPRRAAVALLAPAQILLDLLPLEQEPGREPGHDGDERRPVRLPGSGERQRHGRRLRTDAPITSTGAAAPVQRSKESAPWPTRTSRPSTTRSHPAARAAAISDVSPPSGR